MEGNSLGTWGWAWGKIPTILILAIDGDRTSQHLKLHNPKQGGGGWVICITFSEKLRSSSY